MQTLLQDVRFGLRMLAKNPGFTAVAVITLGLGIGANTAIFSFVDAVLLKPLPFSHPERIVMVWEKPPDGGRNVVSTLNFLDWKNQNTVFEAMAAQGGATMTLSGADQPVMLRVGLVSAPYFNIFGAEPLLGRTFAPDEDQPGKQHEAVLSHRVWENRFGVDPGIIGRTIPLDGEAYTVIGVMPPGLFEPGVSGSMGATRLPAQRVDARFSLAGFIRPLETRRNPGAGPSADERHRRADRPRLPAVEQGMGCNGYPLRGHDGRQ